MTEKYLFSYLKRSNFREFWAISPKLIFAKFLAKANSRKSILFPIFFQTYNEEETKTSFCMHNVSFALQTSDYSAVNLYRYTDCSQKILSKRSQLY